LLGILNHSNPTVFVRLLQSLKPILKFEILAEFERRLYEALFKRRTSERRLSSLKELTFQCADQPRGLVVRVSDY